MTSTQKKQEKLAEFGLCTQKIVYESKGYTILHAKYKEGGVPVLIAIDAEGHLGYVQPIKKNKYGVFSALPFHGLNAYERRVALMGVEPPKPFQLSEITEKKMEDWFLYMKTNENILQLEQDIKTDNTTRSSTIMDSINKEWAKVGANVQQTQDGLTIRWFHLNIEVHPDGRGGVFHRVTSFGETEKLVAFVLNAIQKGVEYPK